MIGIYTANTDGFKKKFTLSFAIKFFTYWYLKEFKLKHPEFSWMKMKDIPTHSLIGFDEGKTGERIIFESSKTQQIYPYYECDFEFEFNSGNDIKLFWKIVKRSVGDWYGIFQLYYFVKTWFWMNLFNITYYLCWLCVLVILTSEIFNLFNPGWIIIIGFSALLLTFIAGFQKTIIRLWSKLFHGGKHIFLWGNPFVKFQICTEQCYNYLQEKSNENDFSRFLVMQQQLARVNTNNVFPLLLLDMLLCITKSGEIILNPNYKKRMQ